MSDNIKIVIEIPRNEYEQTCNLTLHDRTFWDDAIRNGTPLDDVKAENKGEWRHDGSRWKNRCICSACGYKLFDAPTNYCPNCGARMRGGE